MYQYNHIFEFRHCEQRAWEKSPAKKSDDDTGRRHCDCEARSRKQSRTPDSERYTISSLKGTRQSRYH